MARVKKAKEDSDETEVLDAEVGTDVVDEIPQEVSEEPKVEVKPKVEKPAAKKKKKIQIVQ